MTTQAIKEKETYIEGETPKIVQVSDFSGNGSQKIFDDVRKAKVTIVEKDGKPQGVIISPEKYTELLEELEDAYDIMLVQERMKDFDPSKTISQEELDKEFGITEEILEGWEDIEIE